MTFRLERGAGGYLLADSSGTHGALSIDFESLHPRVQRGGRELVARAVQARPGLKVVDATAGLGTDSFILASRGCEVTMIERSHTLYLMLEEALARGERSASVAGMVARMRLLRGDATWQLARLDEPPDVVLIDPMFPSRSKSARVKGSLTTLQSLVGKDQSVLALLSRARAVARQRVVLKRPLRGGEVAGHQPSGSIRGKASRFDIYAPTGAG